MRVLISAAMTASFAAPAFAQDAPPPIAPNGEDIVLELGLGAKVRPAYIGADDYLFSPDPIIALHYLRLPFFTIGGGPETGLSLAPSFRIIPERDDSDYSGLAGLGDVDLAVELGGTIGYRYGMFEVFATLRKGVTGHSGFVGETGIDLVVDPTPRLTVSAGPRLSFADSDYLDTYLGVTAAQSAASGLPVYDPDGGITGIGLGAEARYALSDRWSLIAEAGYERLVGDAADSPVTDAGSADQFSASLGLSYRFGVDFYD